LLLDGLKCLLTSLPQYQLVASDSSWEHLEARLKKNAFDLLLLGSAGASKETASIARAKKKLGFRVIADATEATADLSFNRFDGFEGLKRALIPAGQRTSTVREHVALYGARKDLTPREREVARLVSQGMPNRRIATVLGIQEQSVKNLVSVVMRKLRCENRVQLALHLSSARH
jgi:DNA-binding CsgD family transcriptional regulator